MTDTIPNSHPELRAALEARLAVITRRVDAIEADLRQPGNADWSESATEHENDEVLEGLDSAGLAQIAAIRAALQRMDEGVYGMCISCGDDIPARRLEAMPSATLCVGCASEQERPR